VPDYTVLFVRITLLTALIDVVSGPLMTIITATGRIKLYHLIVGGINIMILPISYYLLNMHYYPHIVFIVALIFSVLLLFVRLFFVKRELNIDILPFLKFVIYKIIIVCFLSFIIINLIKLVNFYSDTYNFLFTSFCSTLIILLIIFIVGLNSRERNYFFKFNKN
jgi:hypothetical protein